MTYFVKNNIFNEIFRENSAEDDPEGFEEFKQELTNNGEIKSQLDNTFYKSIYPGQGYNDYLKSNENDLLKIIDDAKNGNDFATYYLLNKAKQMIYYVFWKNFIGAKASPKIIKRRLDNGEFNDFISLVFIAFAKAIKSFKPSVYRSGEVKIGNWQYWLGQYLRMDAIAYNRDKMADPSENALNPDTMEKSEKGSASAWDKLTADISQNDEDDFLDSWADFCTDPSLDEPVSKRLPISRRQILADVLSQKETIPEVAKKYDVAKNTIYSAISIGDLLKKYNISQEEFARHLHNDPDGIVRTLRHS